MWNKNKQQVVSILVVRLSQCFEKKPLQIINFQTFLFLSCLPYLLQQIIVKLP